MRNLFNIAISRYYRAETVRKGLKPYKTFIARQDVAIGKPLVVSFDSESKSTVSCHDVAGFKIYNVLKALST